MPPPLRLPPPFLLPRRLLTTTPRRRSRPPSSSITPPAAAADDPNEDFYSLILSHPLPSPAPNRIPSKRAPKPSNGSSPPTTPQEKAPPQISFSMPLAGPSARMRGLARGEKGLDRPPEPDNCCMSGCVNCVWEAYREEVEEWALARRERERGLRAGERGVEGKERGLDRKGEGEGVEEGLFEGVPVGMREFMATEKRLRERRQRLKDAG